MSADLDEFEPIKDCAHAARLYGVGSWMAREVRRFIVSCALDTLPVSEEGIRRAHAEYEPEVAVRVEACIREKVARAVMAALDPAAWLPDWMREEPPPVNDDWEPDYT